MSEPIDVNLDQYVSARYQDAIHYYWAASKQNKRWYKVTRSLTIVLGAVVTLIASLSSSNLIEDVPVVNSMFTIGTPLLAAALTIVAGFAQSFQWGSTWQNMVLTAQYLQKEYDTFLITPAADRNYLEESEKLNRYIISESAGFFERMLGGAKPSNRKVDHPKKIP